MTDSDLYRILHDEVSKYNNSIDGIRVRLTYNTPRDQYEIVVQYRYRDETVIPYSELVPSFWINQSEKFVADNVQTLIRYLIKSSISTEINQLFGWKGGFNPL